MDDSGLPFFQRTLEASAAARAAPDGYTLVVASGVVLVNPSVGKVAYDPIKDFAPVA